MVSTVRGTTTPFPPPLDLEQNLKDAPKLGEISGRMFAIRSAYLQRRVERRPQSCQPLRLACINEGYARQKAVEGSGPPYQVWNGKALRHQRPVGMGLLQIAAESPEHG